MAFKPGLRWCLFVSKVSKREPWLTSLIPPLRRSPPSSTAAINPPACQKLPLVAWHCTLSSDKVHWSLTKPTYPMASARLGNPFFYLSVNLYEVPKLPKERAVVRVSRPNVRGVLLLNDEGLLKQKREGVEVKSTKPGRILVYGGAQGRLRCAEGLLADESREDQVAGGGGRANTLPPPTDCSSTVYVGRQVLKRGVITVTGSIEGATAGRQRRKVLHWQEK
ncbi:hypothetical protein BHM03_00023063 [Ensete ventricosum]|nr:hypothetical protein BHM03_00023063 [Ensete ventricosum]